MFAALMALRALSESCGYGRLSLTMQECECKDINAAAFTHLSAEIDVSNYPYRRDSLYTYCVLRILVEF
jgi:hypothetical protein